MMNVSINTMASADAAAPATDAALPPRVAGAGSKNDRALLSHGATVFSDPAPAAAQWNQLALEGDANSRDVDAAALRQKLAALPEGFRPYTAEDFEALTPEEKEEYATTLARDMSECVAMMESGGDPSTLLSSAGKLVGHALLGPEGAGDAPVILLLLLQLFAEKRKSDLQNFSASLETTKQLLTTMLDRMDTQIKEQNNASWSTSFTEIIGGALQISLSAASLVKSGSLMKEKDRLLSLQGESKQLSSSTEKTAETVSEAKRLANDIGATTPDKTQISKVGDRLEKLETHAEETAEGAARIEEKLHDPVTGEQLKRNIAAVDGDLNKWQTVSQTASAFAQVSQGIGSAIAAPYTADSQTAGKGKEEMDGRMNLEQQARSLQMGFADAFSNVIGTTLQAFEQILSTNAESAKTASRNVV
jgi:hypothetical protein